MATPSTSAVTDVVEKENRYVRVADMAGTHGEDDIMDVERALAQSEVHDRQSEVEELKVCDLALRSVREIEIVVVAEVAKHWRTSEPKRESFEKVARDAAQVAMQHILDLKELCLQRRGERECLEVLMECLGSTTRYEVVEKMEELVSHGEVVKKVVEITGWQPEQIVKRCCTMREKIDRKKQHIAELQRQLELREKELEELRRRAQTLCSQDKEGREAKESSTIPVLRCLGQ
ncbi:unnamed protein product [Heligmosomoides polygyrus]|uniref:OBERON-like protein n=1 Tax=Heligmosomoides polygyrus TaxID=6339 RepID=A0A183FGU5_HELPZ|nr:unnamed protein product [Heligmosomoides polygyrus]